MYKYLLNAKEQERQRMHNDILKINSEITETMMERFRIEEFYRNKKYLITGIPGLLLLFGINTFSLVKILTNIQMISFITLASSCLLLSFSGITLVRYLRDCIKFKSVYGDLSNLSLEELDLKIIDLKSKENSLNRNRELLKEIEYKMKREIQEIKITMKTEQKKLTPEIIPLHEQKYQQKNQEEAKTIFYDFKNKKIDYKNVHLETSIGPKTTNQLKRPVNNINIDDLEKLFNDYMNEKIINIPLETYPEVAIDCEKKLIKTHNNNI